MKNKIIKIHDIVMSRLPEKYYASIKLFPNTKSLFKYEAKERGITYKYILEECQGYLSDPLEATYIKTKHDSSRKFPPKSPLQVSALSGNPIFISCGRLKEKKATKQDIAFLILHEIGHNILEHNTERNADLFAIRWIKKFIKEGLIK